MHAAAAQAFRKARHKAARASPHARPAGHASKGRGRAYLGQPVTAGTSAKQRIYAPQVRPQSTRAPQMTDAPMRRRSGLSSDHFPFLAGQGVGWGSRCTPPRPSGFFVRMGAHKPGFGGKGLILKLTRPRDAPRGPRRCRPLYQRRRETRSDVQIKYCIQT